MKNKWTGRKGYDKNEWYGITETGCDAWDTNTEQLCLKMLNRWHRTMQRLFSVTLRYSEILSEVWECSEIFRKRSSGTAHTPPACWQVSGDKLKLIAEQVRPAGSALMLLKWGYNNTEWDSAVYSIAIFVAITSNLFYVDFGKDKLLVAEAINVLGRNTAALLSNAGVHT